MVFVHFQVTVYVDVQVDAAMLAYLFQHVVEESQSGMDMAGAVSVQVHPDTDIGFLSLAAYLGSTFTGKEKLCHAVPVGGS